MPRREFLYDIKFWEVRRILRGYRKRNRLSHQLLAEVVYAAMYANPYRKHDGKSVADMFPNLFEDDRDMGPGITEKEQNELLELMAAENARLEKERKSSEK